MTNAQTIDKLYEMKMSPMARCYRDQAEQERCVAMNFDERFAMIVDAEWDSRRENKRLRLLRNACFAEPDADMTDVMYFEDRKLNKAQLAELSNCKWIAEKHNLIFTGASGAGKSWLSCALGVAACNAFYSVRYTRLPEMLDEICASKDELWLKSKKKYIKCDLLIIDDWLLEAVQPDQAREILEVIEHRTRTGSLILCSQFGAAGWHDKLGRGAVADAVIDRIVHNSYTIHIEGEESMRKRLSKIR